MADGEGMGRKRNIKTMRVEPGKGRVPEAIQYRALASMSRTDSVQDKNQRDRKAARQALRKGDYDG